MAIGERVQLVRGDYQGAHGVIIDQAVRMELEPDDPHRAVLDIRLEDGLVLKEVSFLDARPEDWDGPMPGPTDEMEG